MLYILLASDIQNSFELSPPHFVLYMIHDYVVKNSKNGGFGFRH